MIRFDRRERAGKEIPVGSCIHSRERTVVNANTLPMHERTIAENDSIDQELILHMTAGSATPCLC